MKLFIPKLSQKLRLIDDWTFDLEPIWGNGEFAEALGLKYSNTVWDRDKRVWSAFDRNTSAHSYGPLVHTLTLNKGTILSITKYEIRKRAQDDILKLRVWLPGKKRSEKFLIHPDKANFDCEIV